ncbi:transmembrane protein 135 [Eurytemora carolleeae]|uniref:transmembrane protein 135 n=1 Tax=Eurytemora carolleeae TaxID=1294199 RepID=UPI000C7782D7|nr:transmembrane protein 135 [Eurytemora carolleeae]|eukprot:XP_023328885.1 transmembrane protein 135-like [Eurytemora affinis]
MGLALSKFRPLDYSCYEMTHTWSPLCSAAALDIGFACVLQSLRIYTTVYAGTTVLKCRIPSRADLIKLVLSILQSTAFLSYNAFGFATAHCLVRQVLGFCNFWSLGLIPGWISSFLAIFVEKHSRRGMLATYVTNVASESIYYSLRNNNIIDRKPYIDYLLFSISMSGYHYLNTTLETPSLDPALKLTRLLIQDSKSEKLASKNLQEGHKHQQHDELDPDQQHDEFDPDQRHAYLTSAIKASFKHFLFGAGGQILLSLFNLIRKGRRSSGGWIDKTRIGFFLGSLTLLSRMSMFVLRKFSGSVEGWHGLVAGLISSPSYLIYRNNSIPLYAFWKLVEIVLRMSSKSGYLPKIPFATELIYASSTAVLFHMGMLEPQSLRKSYVAFLDQVTGKKIGKVNRLLVDHEYKTNSSKTIQYKPIYQEAHISDQLKSLLPDVGTLKNM